MNHNDEPEEVFYSDALKRRLRGEQPASRLGQAHANFPSGAARIERKTGRVEALLDALGEEASALHIIADSISQKLDELCGYDPEGLSGPAVLEGPDCALGALAQKISRVEDARIRFQRILERLDAVI